MKHYRKLEILLLKPSASNHFVWFIKTIPSTRKVSGGRLFKLGSSARGLGARGSCTVQYSCLQRCSLLDRGLRLCYGCSWDLLDPLLQLGGGGHSPKCSDDHRDHCSSSPSFLMSLSFQTTTSPLHPSCPLRPSPQFSAGPPSPVRQALSGRSAGS